MSSEKRDDWEDVEEWEEEDHVDTEEPRVELDPDDALSVPQQYYTVQGGYKDLDGSEVEPGEQVEVKCGNCAVWEAPLKARSGKALCYPGRKIEIENDGDSRIWRMNSDRHSCQKYFVPRDMEGMLELITRNPSDLMVLRWAFPAIIKLVALQQRILTYYEKHELDGAEKAIDRVFDLVTLFSSEEQIDYVKPFILSVEKAVKAAQKRKTRRKTRFRAHDVVTWDDTASGERVEGHVVSISRKFVRLEVRGENVKSLRPELAKKALAESPTRSTADLRLPLKLDLTTWRKRNPELASRPIVLEE